MAIKINTAMRNIMADAFGSNFAGGTCQVRTGSAPATGDSTATGTLLATFDLSGVGFNAASAGAVVATGTPVSATAVASGTAGWARFSDGTRSFDGTIGVSGSGADFIISPSATIASGSSYSLSAISITVPAS